MLVVSDGGMVLCFWPGHTRASSPETFAATIADAWRAARKRQIVNLTEAGALKLAWRLVRGRTAAGGVADGSEDGAGSGARDAPAGRPDDRPEPPTLFAVRD